MKITIFVILLFFFHAASWLTNASAEEITQLNDHFLLDQAKLDKLELKVQKIKKDSTATSQKLSSIERYQSIAEEWRDAYYVQRDGIKLAVDDSSLEGISEKDKEKITQLKDQKEALLEQFQQLFQTVSKKRSEIIKTLFLEDKASDIELNSEFANDLMLEMKSIPLRWISLFKTRFLKINENINGGISGWVYLLKEVVSALIVFLLGGVFYVLFKKISVFLNGIRDEHSKRAFREKRSRLISKWLGRVSPFLPWIWVVIFFGLSEEIVAGGYFKELIILFPYFTYYAYYKIFRIIVKQILSNHSFYKYDRNFQLDKKKLNWTSRFLGHIFLSIVVIQHTLVSAGGEGFLYTWISEIFTYFFLFVIFYVSNKWRKEISLVAQKTFSGHMLKIVNFSLLGYRSFFCCVIVLILEIIYQFLFSVYSFLERFDLIRAISAQYFRKKVETIKHDTHDDKLKELPMEYLEKFYSVDPASFVLQDSQKKIYDSLWTNINKWSNNESDEHIALVYGEKGVGKTFLLERLENNLTDCVKLFYKLSNRISQKEQLNQIIAELRPKKDNVVVFIDGLQYLFLSKRKGFEFFKEFLKMTQEENFKNVFWCLGINNYSWEFIESVLNKNRYFNFIYKIDRWREEDIQSFLVKKHNCTDYDLIYDEVLYSANRVSENEEFDIEGRYFRILWEEAMGNPSVAQKIWISSLKYIREGRVKAVIPEERSEFLVQLPDEFFFVLASIVRHECLDILEIQESTNLSEDIVRNSVKICLEKGYLTRDKNSNVSISLMAQHAVYSTLKRMNFIYG